MLGRAAAIVAEQGTAAGHLANVAREFGVPAILGMGGATDLFKNGQPVTVDADGLRVCRGKIESLLRNRETIQKPYGWVCCPGHPEEGIRKDNSSLSARSGVTEFQACPLPDFS